MRRRTPRSSVFPYTTLFRSLGLSSSLRCGILATPPSTEAVIVALGDEPVVDAHVGRELVRAWRRDKPLIDRKSTRLNSSHPSISYAVFCSKKKIMIILRTAQ